MVIVPELHEGAKGLIIWTPQASALVLREPEGMREHEQGETGGWNRELVIGYEPGNVRRYRDDTRKTFSGFMSHW
jgi:hypothetical protein